MLPILACLALIVLSAALTPYLHQREVAREWNRLLQEARDCTAARDGGHADV